MTYKTDVLVIGAGAVGTAIARELSKYKLKVMVDLYMELIWNQEKYHMIIIL